MFIMLLRMLNVGGSDRLHYLARLNQVTRVNTLQVEHGVCISYIPARLPCYVRFTLYDGTFFTQMHISKSEMVKVIQREPNITPIRGSVEIKI